MTVAANNEPPHQETNPKCQGTHALGHGGKPHHIPMAYQQELRFITTCQLQQLRCAPEHVINTRPTSDGKNPEGGSTAGKKPAPISTYPSRGKWRERMAVSPYQDLEESSHLSEVRWVRGMDPLPSQSSVESFLLSCGRKEDTEL